MRAPVPVLVSARVPLPSSSVPLKVVGRLVPPAVSMAATPVLVTVPLPAKEPIELEKPPRSKIEVTVKLELPLNPVVEPASSVPALTVVAPVVVLAPLKVKVPVPALVNAKTPVPFCNTPLKVVVALSPPAVSVAAAPVSATVPLPANEPIELVKPPRFNMEVTVKSEFELNPVAEPACNVPTLTVVTPL